jgi:hypothetical protein
MEFAGTPRFEREFRNLGLSMTYIEEGFDLNSDPYVLRKPIENKD